MIQLQNIELTDFDKPKTKSDDEQKLSPRFKFRCDMEKDLAKALEISGYSGKSMRGATHIAPKQPTGWDNTAVVFRDGSDSPPILTIAPVSVHGGEAKQTKDGIWRWHSTIVMDSKDVDAANAFYDSRPNWIGVADITVRQIEMDLEEPAADDSQTDLPLDEDASDTEPAA